MHSAGTRFQPGGLWSLWDMWKVDAQVFYWISTALQRVQVAARILVDKQGLKKNDKISEQRRSELLEQVTKLGDEIGVLEAQLTFTSVRRFIEVLKAGTITYGSLIDHLDQIDRRLRDELSLATVLVIDEKMKELFESAALFGPDVESKFPQMSEDISEAGKCLALARPTACVFHLMRIMEIAVQRLGDKVGVQLVNELNWQVILDQINKAIRSMDHKLPETKLFAETAFHLYSVKIAWRNEVMHPKQTYTAEEADIVFRNVRTFAQELARII